MAISPTYPTPIEAANAGAAARGSAGAATATNALAKLTGNFDDFLKLLTTQLKNQDPTAPMDTNQFTSQLVQFTAVSQQIGTNATLNQLLSASLTQQLGQASSLVGTDVSISGSMLPLQKGVARIDFQSSGAQPVQISVYDADGLPVHSHEVDAANGANTWTWDGKGPEGQQLPDGAYTVAASAAGTNLDVRSTGRVTGAEQSKEGVQLKFGAASAGYNKVVSLGRPGS